VLTKENQFFLAFAGQIKTFISFTTLSHESIRLYHSYSSCLARPQYQELLLDQVNQI
jgi:hypothetical protein